MSLLGNAIAYPVSTLIGALSIILTPLVLAYRWKRTPGIRGALDRFQRRFTGRPDWSWLSLRHILIALLIVTAANVGWQVATVHCYDDSLAILASGEAALHGQNPFLVEFCGQTSSSQIPYGTAEVALNALGALSGNVLGMWLVWQLLALAVIPLVWSLAGEERRYVTALTAVSILYLPNITTNIGVENAVVAVSVLLMLYALTLQGTRSWTLKVVAAFLSTARFPAIFPLLGSSASLRRGRLQQTLLVLGTFFGAILLSYAIWGRSAIQVVYFGQVTRASDESLNFFALLLTAGWFPPSLVSAAIQGAGLIVLVLLVNWRRYSAIGAVALPLLGVMALSQYLTFHFVLWIVPLILLGWRLNWWLYIYGAVAWFDETVALGYFGVALGVWWPYVFLGLVLTGVLIYLAIEIIRAEEARLKASREAPATIQEPFSWTSGERQIPGSPVATNPL